MLHHSYGREISDTLPQILTANMFIWTHAINPELQGGRGRPSYDAGGLSCSNDNLWFSACSTAYKEAPDYHWPAAPWAMTTTN